VLKCGWGAKRGPRCAIEYSEQDEFTWMLWELKMRGKSRTTGNPVCAYEWIPHKGTWASFMKELEDNHNESMPHVEAVREDRQVKKLIEERLALCKDVTVMMDKTDCSSDFETERPYCSTCVASESHKLLVSVSGCELRFEQCVVPKRGKRPEKVIYVMVQEPASCLASSVARTATATKPARSTAA